MHPRTLFLLLAFSLLSFFPFLACTDTPADESVVELHREQTPEPDTAEPAHEPDAAEHDAGIEPVRDASSPEPRKETTQKPDTRVEPRKESKPEPVREVVPEPNPEPDPEPVQEVDAGVSEPGVERTTPDWVQPEDQKLESVNSNINWASLQWPPTVSMKPGIASRPIYGQIYVKGLTDTIKAAHPGLRAQLGAGPWGTTPQSHPSKWTWVNAKYVKNAGLGGNNHEYSATLKLPKSGLYQYAYRFSLYKGAWQVADRNDYGRRGTDDGVSLQELGVAVVVDTKANLRIGSFNLHCLVDKPAARFQEAVRRWKLIQPDVIGLQEVCAPTAGGQNSAETLAALLKKAGLGTYKTLFVPTHTATHSGVSYKEGLGILSRVPVLESQAFDLPASGTRPSGAFPRKMLWARIATPLGIVSFGSVHLSFRSNHEFWRLKQVETIKKVMASSQTWSDARIVVGDFNSKDGSPPISMMKKNNQPAGTFVFQDLLKTLDSGFTFPTRSPSIRIDYLFLSQPSGAPLKFSVTSGKRIFARPTSSGLLLSDHLGLRATLQGR